MTADRRGDYLQDVSIDLFRYRSVEVRAGRIQPRGVRPGGVRAGERTGGACGEPIPTMSRNCPVISPGIGIFHRGSSRGCFYEFPRTSLQGRKWRSRAATSVLEYNPSCTKFLLRVRNICRQREGGQLLPLIASWDSTTCITGKDDHCRRMT